MTQYNDAHNDARGIGWRVATWRGRAGLTQRELAERMGVDRSYVSHIEAGDRQVANRRTWTALATALGVGVEDLTGQPVPPRNADELVLYSLAPALRRGLDDEDDPPPVRAAAQVAADVDRSFGLRMNADWEALASLLPALLAETAGLEGDEGKMLQIRAVVNASLTCRSGGYLDLSRRCAERAVALAAALGEPVHLGGAAFALGQSALAGGSLRHALAVTAVAAQALEDSGTSGEDARAITGMLHLASALSAGASGDLARASLHLDEAAYLAEHVGVGDPWWFEFGPPNVGCWRVAVACELGEWDRAPELAAQVDRGALRTPDRRARLLVDAARGWYESGHPERATNALLDAMDVSARATRVLPSVREVVAQMARDAGPRGGSDALRRLVTSVGVDPLST